LEKRKTKNQEFEKIIGAKCESKYMHAKEILEFIKKQPRGEQDGLWKFLIENFGTIQSDLEIKADKDYGEVWDRLKDKLRVNISAFLDDVKKRNGEPEEVVGLMKENLQKIKGKEGKIIFLAYVLMSKYSIVPYFKLKYPVLDDEYIKDLPEDIKRRTRLISMILRGYTRFRNSREICAAIAQIIDEEKDMKRKILLVGVTAMTVTEPMPSGIIAISMPSSLSDILSMLNLSDILQGVDPKEYP
jgi:hypothetical protein